MSAGSSSGVSGFVDAFLLVTEESGEQYLSAGRTAEFAFVLAEIQYHAEEICSVVLVDIHREMDGLRRMREFT